MASTAASIQRTLNLIIPTASTLPPSLIDLATNLLAQSRAKAPTLKPDEEIARPFACCHIACERLKNRLALEIGKVGPPCGPRIYKRLYAFLDSSLAAEPSTPRTKRVHDVEATPASGRSGRLATSGGAKATPGSLGKRTRATPLQDNAASNLPRFTMPLIRHVCKECETPRVAMHVYTGVESVYRSLQRSQELEANAPGTPSKRRRSNNGEAEAVTSGTLPVPRDEQVPALVAVVYLMTAASPLGSGNLAVNEQQRVQAQSAVESYFTKQKSAAVTPDPDAIEQDISAYLQAAMQGWADMEWYKNLPTNKSGDTGPEGAAGEDANEEGGPVTPRKRPAKTPLRRKEKHSQRKIGEDDHEPAGLLPGLGTMFQPAVDWLNEDRRADFAVWKQDVLRSITEIEQKS